MGEEWETGIATFVSLACHSGCARKRISVVGMDSESQEVAPTSGLVISEIAWSTHTSKQRDSG